MNRHAFDWSREWQTESDPENLLAAVPNVRGLDRRLRLFACASVRQVWHLLPSDTRSAVEVSERLANGGATPADLRAAAVRLYWIRNTPSQIAIEAAGYASGGFLGVAPPARSLPLEYDPRLAARLAARAWASVAVGPAPPLVTPNWHHKWTCAYQEARAGQANLVRCLFPPPGFPSQLPPQWRSSTVVALARQIDATGNFASLPILADALQEAGCESDPLLQWCRMPGINQVRGHWVVDCVLDRL